jgi:glycosyltransferase involved in cell wall biosynthesis
MSMMTALFVLYVGVTLAQIAIWQFVFGRLVRHRPAAAIAPTGLPPVSVIICARNEAHNLRKNLPAVLAQQYPLVEVLVVDDDSGDDTGAVLSAFQTNYAHLRVLRLSPKTSPGKKYALAQGIEAARYEHLVFTDADCAPASVRWLEHLAGGFWCVSTPPPSPPPNGRGLHAQVSQNSTWDQAPLPFGGGDGGGVETHSVPTPQATPQSPIEIVLGYAPYRPGPGLLNRWIRFETIFTAMQYFSFTLVGRPYMGVGRNLAWHKSLFQRVGGFAAHAHVPSGDDDLLVNAAAHAENTALCLAPEAFVYSDAESTWADWFRQKQRHLGAGRFYRREHQIALGLLTLTQVLHYFLLFVLLFSGFGTVSVILFVVRLTISAGFFRKILRQFRDEPLLVWFPLLDALLAIYFAVLVPLILIRSNHLISWK